MINIPVQRCGDLFFEAGMGLSGGRTFYEIQCSGIVYVVSQLVWGNEATTAEFSIAVPTIKPEPGSFIVIFSPAHFSSAAAPDIERTGIFPEVVRCPARIL